MGQTLTHGVYLPDEGERNCYNGLAANWQLLDTSVGTIAEHTSALSGKAPLVHTHGNITNDGKVGTTANKPLITGTSGVVQAGSFGNAANTFCEGNDSRLSDARTPIAHTHTKSDVTDLLNSNFIPSANNSYDLGSSSYQWNNLYAKNYYYNGVAWGLDKENVWTGQNTFKATVTYEGNFACYWKRSNLIVGTLPSSAMYYGATRYADSEGTTITLTRGLVDTSGKNYFRQYTFAFNDTSKFCSMGSGINADGSGSYFAFTAESVIPSDNNTTDLGTTNNRWKTLNGINPGALSLPDVFNSYDVITTNWSTSYSNPNNLQINGANPSYPGWLYIRLDNCTAADDFVIVRYFHVNAVNLTFFGSFIPKASSYVLTVPIQAGITTKVWVSKIPTTCKYYACLGTVK